MGKRARLQAKVKPVSMDKLIKHDWWWKWGLIALAIALFLVPYYVFMSLRSVELDYQVEVRAYTTHRVVDSSGEVSFAVIFYNTGKEAETFRFEVEGEPPGASVRLDYEKTRVKVQAGRNDTNILTVTTSGDTPTRKDYSLHVVVWPEHNPQLRVKQKFTVRVMVDQYEDREVIEGDRVLVDYTGFIREGLVFDTSEERIGDDDSIPKFHSFNPKDDYSPVEFGTNDVVPGFKAGLIGMREGQSRAVRFEPEQGYGADPAGHDLGGQWLCFEITLIQIM